MALGDLGADVIKVERPGAGDDTRGWGPPFDERGEAAYYLSVNRNKLSVALDLDLGADRETLRALILSADVVVENFRAGTLERKGLGRELFMAVEPGLLWCTLSGFGPGDARPGYDFVVQAESGWMSITGEPEGEPMKVGVALADVIAGKDAATAILAAIAGRERGSLADEERRLHVSLLHSAMASLVNVAQNTLVSGSDARRWGNAHANLCPYELFHASDAPVVIAVGSDAQWLACATTLGLHDLANDETLRTNRGRLASRDRIVAAIRARVATGRAAEWARSLTLAAVPCGVVKTVREALASADASALTGVHPGRPGAVRFAPPRLDEHGPLVREHGWNAFAMVKPLAGAADEH
jgi:crotonobetainyl-CoA:carnitine CoA-transferase CaiB-like acyl-CoA transferase